jgi:hypothetical protein
VLRTPGRATARRGEAACGDASRSPRRNHEPGQGHSHTEEDVDEVDTSRGFVALTGKARHPPRCQTSAVSPRLLATHLGESSPAAPRSGRLSSPSGDGRAGRRSDTREAFGMQGHGSSMAEQRPLGESSPGGVVPARRGGRWINGQVRTPGEHRALVTLHGVRVVTDSIRGARP